jgi:hypothetical protein
MQTSVSRNAFRTTGNQGIVYRTVCQNPGCGFKFDLRIAPENASLLGGAMACPHCKRHGGQLKSQGRISKGFSPPSYCSARPGLDGRAATKTKRGRTPRLTYWLRPRSAAR